MVFSAGGAKDSNQRSPRTACSLYSFQCNVFESWLAREEEEHILEINQPQPRFCFHCFSSRSALARDSVLRACCGTHAPAARGRLGSHSLLSPVWSVARQSLC